MACRPILEQRLVLKYALDSPDAEIIEHGVLILDLRTAKICNHSLASKKNGWPLNQSIYCRPNRVRETGRPEKDA